MGPFSAILIALGGIAFVICIFQLMILIWKKGAVIFIFGAVLSQVYFLYVITTYLAIKNQPSPSALLPDLKIQMVLFQVVILAFIGVSYLLLGVKSKILIISAILVVLLEVVIGFSLPEKVLFGEDTGLSLIVMATGERFLMIPPGFTIWRLMINVSIFTYLIFLFILLSKSLYKYTFSYLFQVASGAGILLTVGLFDQLVDLGSIQFYYLLPFGLFANYFILTHIPIGHMMKDVFRHYEVADKEKKWRTLINQANVIVVSLNRMGHVEFVNPYFLKLTGYKESEVLGKDWFEFLIPSDQYYDVQSAFIEVLEFDFHPKYRNPILTKFQEKRLIDWYNVRIRNLNEQVTGSISIGIDITEDDQELSVVKQKLADAEALISRMRKEGNVF
jgi:PAS domain S-box-containing protein